MIYNYRLLANVSFYLIDLNFFFICYLVENPSAVRNNGIFPFLTSMMQYKNSSFLCDSIKNTYCDQRRKYKISLGVCVPGTEFCSGWTDSTEQLPGLLTHRSCTSRKIIVVKGT